MIAKAVVMSTLCTPKYFNNKKCLKFSTGDKIKLINTCIQQIDMIKYDVLE